MSEPDNTALVEILECYVLDAIGLLADGRRRDAEAAVAAELGAGDWRATVRAQVGLPEGFDGNVLEMYKEFVVSTEDAGADLPPEHFARVFVGRHFVTNEDD